MYCAVWVTYIHFHKYTRKCFFSGRQREAGLGRRVIIHLDNYSLYLTLQILEIRYLLGMA